MIIGCYARLSLQGDAKMYQCFKNIRLFLSRRGHYIGRKTPHPFTPCPVRDKIFSSSHYVPNGTLISGGILLSTDMLSPAGRKTTFFRTDFSKKRILHFYIPLGG